MITIRFLGGTDAKTVSVSTLGEARAYIEGLGDKYGGKFEWSGPVDEELETVYEVRDEMELWARVCIPRAVCSHCNDTHRMPLRDSYVPCTWCPTPCKHCATSGGRGAYCKIARCDCDCHGPNQSSIARVVSHAKAYLAGGISPPMHEGTTPRLAKALVNLADLVQEYLDARGALRGCGYSRGCQTHAPCMRLDTARDALETALTEMPPRS